MTPDQLNQDFGIPDRIAFSDGQGGLTIANISNSAATLSLSLYGGQVLSYRPRTIDDDLLFVSDSAHFRAGKAIKGGIPICWPWFGAAAGGSDLPAHGFARTSHWAVAAADAINDNHTRLVLRLGDDDNSRTLWPHAFELTLTIDVADTLTMTLETENRGNQPFDVTQAMHTYFAIADIGDVRIAGLDGKTYLDKPRDFAADRQHGPVRFDGEVDRIYQAVTYPLTIDDRGNQRRIAIDAEHSQTAVVWNPGPAISAAMGDLDDDAYRRFVCVETANAADEVVTVPPGQACHIRSRYRIAAATDGA
jgi:glucose-6-phosphate 1-epimerase